MLKIVFYVVIAVIIGKVLLKIGDNSKNEKLSGIITGVGIPLRYSIWPAITIFYALELWKSNSWFLGIVLAIVTLCLVLYGNEEYAYQLTKNKAYIWICILGIIPYFFAVSTFDAQYDKFRLEKEAYNSKIITTTENEVITSEEIRGPLTYFCNIPVQNVSGHINSSSILGGGGGDISTTDNLVYWYLQGEVGVCDNAPAKSSRMIPLQEGEDPYVRIVTYCNREKTVNGNNGEVSYNVTAKWTEYEFYLPKEVVEGQFNN